MTKEEQEWFHKTFFRELRDEHYFLLRPEGDHVFPAVRENFFSIARSFGVRLQEHKRFIDPSDKREVFILYSVE